MIKNALQTISENFIKLQEQADTIQAIADMWIEALKTGNKIIFCGNG